MATMIPSVISPDVKSTAERRIFKWFQEAPGTDNWIVLHSLGIASHNRVVYGETDFFVLAPGLGLYALEVKGGRVSCKDGTWYFTDKYDHSNSKARGPFDQARDGIFNIVNGLKERLDSEHQRLNKIFFGYGVMFPDFQYEADGIDEAQWQVFDERDGNHVRSYIQRLFEGAKNRWESVYGPLDPARLPDKEDARYLASLLRKDFDYAVSINMQLKNAEESLISLTQEQYRCLDQLDDNPRCLIYGPAGTGKTLLAIEEVKKSAARGERVALICFNASLADWLNNYFQNVEENLRPTFVGTLHKYIAAVIKTANVTVPYPTDSGKIQSYYQEVLPEEAARILECTSDGFDKIIVDEAQDLIRESFLKVLDVSLKKGLSRGKWTMFGDFSMQAIYTDGISGPDLIEKLEDYSWFIRFKLTVNCRNTKPICEEIQTVTGFKASGDLWMKVEGPPVQYITWSSEEEQCEKLKHLLQQLDESNIYPEKITILSPRKKEDSVVSMLEEDKVHNFHAKRGRYVTFSTIQGFKGLENSVIILTDIDSFSADKLMYVGLSRACSGLFILESEKAHQEYNQLLMRRFLQ